MRAPWLLSASGYALPRLEWESSSHPGVCGFDLKYTPSLPVQGADLTRNPFGISDAGGVQIGPKRREEKLLQKCIGAGGRSWAPGSQSRLGMGLCRQGYSAQSRFISPPRRPPSRLPMPHEGRVLRINTFCLTFGPTTVKHLESLPLPFLHQRR